VDSTGLKLGGAGEWLIEKHGQSRRRSWRKLHIGVDANSGEIVAVEVTGKDIDDAAMVDRLLDQIDDPLCPLPPTAATIRTGSASRFPNVIQTSPSSYRHGRARWRALQSKPHRPSAIATCG
jgi:hypothetical protein